MCVCVCLSVCARNTTAHVVYLAAAPLMLPTLPDSPLNHIMSYRCPHALLQRHALRSEPIVAPSVAGCLTSWKKNNLSLCSCNFCNIDKSSLTHMSPTGRITRSATTAETLATSIVTETINMKQPQTWQNITDHSQ